MLVRDFEKLRATCLPAYAYGLLAGVVVLGSAVTGLFEDNPTLSACAIVSQILFAVFWVFILSRICKAGYTLIAWGILLLPFLIDIVHRLSFPQQRHKTAAAPPPPPGRAQAHAQQAQAQQAQAQQAHAQQAHAQQAQAQQAHAQQAQAQQAQAQQAQAQQAQAQQAHAQQARHGRKGGPGPRGRRHGGRDGGHVESRTTTTTVQYS